MCVSIKIVHDFLNTRYRCYNRVSYQILQLKFYIEFSFEDNFSSYFYFSIVNSDAPKVNDTEWLNKPI